MSAALEKLSPLDVQGRLAAGRAVLVDIREPDEFARSRVAGAISRPLSRAGDGLALDRDAEVIFTCRSGMRTAGAADRLAAHAGRQAYVLDGGLDAWARAGLPLARDRAAPLELNRQVQIAAGTMILLGVVLGLAMSPLWFGLAGFVGAGLTFAGLTGTCGLARVLMLAPWNQPA